MEVVRGVGGVHAQVQASAELQLAAADPRAVVEYHFPVVIEVREATAPDADAVAELAAAKLLSGMWT